MISRLIYRRQIGRFRIDVFYRKYVRVQPKFFIEYYADGEMYSDEGCDTWLHVIYRCCGFITAVGMRRKYHDFQS